MDPEICGILLEGMREADDAFTRLVARARAREVTANADAAVLGKLVYATLQSLALRARAGASRAELDAVAEAAVSVICGASGAART